MFSQAQDHIQQGRFDEAGFDYSKILNREPQNTEALRLRGVCREALGQFDLALEDYERILELKPEGTDVYRDIGDVLDALGEEQEAVVAYSRAILHASEDARGYLDRGSLHLQLGDFESALADFDAVIALEPSAAEGYVGRADCLVALEEDTRALGDYKHALDLDANNLSALWGSTQTLLRLGDQYDVRDLYGNSQDAYRRAREGCEAALKIDPTNPWFRVLLAVAARALADYDHAVAAVDESLIDGSKDADLQTQLHAERGDSLRLWGDELHLDNLLIDAVAEFSLAEETAGSSVDCSWLFELKGQALTSLDRYEEALAAFSEALERNRSAVWARLGSGRICLLSGEHLEAQKQFKKALSTSDDPDAFEAWSYVGMGIALERAGRPDRQVNATLDRALRNPDEADEHLDRAGKFLFFRDWRRAEADIRNAIKLSSDSPKALNALAWFCIDQAAVPELDEAQKLASLAIELERQPYDLADYLDTAGWVSLRLGRLEEAKDRLTRAIQLNPHPVSIRAHLREVQEQIEASSG